MRNRVFRVMLLLSVVAVVASCKKDLFDEEEYKTDQPMDVKSQFGQGYTFPCLFKTPAAWVLISETGVDGSYVGSHLSDYNAATGYTIAFPQAGENNGIGSATAGIPLPYSTPWRTITVGTSLQPIVETTIAYDVVKPKYAPSVKYDTGRYTYQEKEVVNPLLCPPHRRSAISRQNASCRRLTYL